MIVSGVEEGTRVVGERLEVVVRSCSAEKIKLVQSKLVKKEKGVRART